MMHGGDFKSGVRFPVGEVHSSGLRGVEGLCIVGHALERRSRIFHVNVAWPGRRHDFVTSRSRRHESELSQAFSRLMISPNQRLKKRVEIVNEGKFGENNNEKKILVE